LNDARAPGPLKLAREIGSFGVMRYLARFGSTVSVPRLPDPSTLKPTLIVPGFMADDAATARMRRSFNAAGLPAYGWALGRNRGVTEDILEDVDCRVRTIQADAGTDAPINIVGWSLGGLIAREYSKAEPQRVAKVITLGSPFSGDLHNNNAWRMYEFVAGHLVDDPPITADLQQKPPVPTIAFWSKRDGVGAPAAARGKQGEADEFIELDCTHMAFVSHPESIRAVADVLHRG